MKKTILYITTSLALFIATVVAPHVLAAQGDASIDATLTTETACTWMGDPFDSELRVEDDSVCVITGSHPLGGATYTRKATIEGDLNDNGVGGILIVGSTTVDTEFGIQAASGPAIVNNGTIIIGQGTTHGYASKIVTAAGNDVEIYGYNTISTFKASLETTSNTTTNAHNLIQVGGSLNVGISTNETGRLTLNDNATSTVATNINVYDELNISSATLSATGSGSQITIGPQATADANVTITNNGTLQTTTTYSFSAVNVFYESTVTNSGYIYSDYIYIGRCSGIACGDVNTQGGTVTNSGTMRSTTTPGFIHLYDGTLNNTGTLQATAGAWSLLEVYDNASTSDPSHQGILTNSSSGFINVSRFMIGDSTTGTLRNGGKLILNNSARLYSTSTAASTIYSGIIENNNVTTVSPLYSISTAGAITVSGTASKAGSLISKGLVANNRGITVIQYGSMELSESTSKWRVPAGYYATVRSDFSGANKGQLTIGTGSTLSAVSGVVCGALGDSSQGGILINNGSIRALDTSGNPIDAAQAVNVYGTSTLTNNGTITVYSGSLATWHSAVLTNSLGASITKGAAATQYTTIYNTSKIDNYGSINGNIMWIGYNASSTGGTFNNYGTLNLNNLLQIHHGGVFDNKTDGIVNNTSTSSLVVGYTSSTNVAYFYQRARTANSNTKATFSTATVTAYGEAQSWDTIAINSTLTIDASGKYYQKNSPNSLTTVTGTTSVGGFLEVELNSNFIGTSAITVTSTGSLTNNGKVTGNETTTNPITVSGGKIVSSSASEFSLASSSYDGIYGTTANTTEIEIAGIVTTNNNIKIDAGTLCFGDYTSPDCVSSGVTQTMGNLTGAALADAINTNVLVGNNITFSYILLYTHIGEPDTRTTTFTSIATANIIVTGNVDVVDDNTLMILNGDFDQSTGIFFIEGNAKVKLLHPTASYTFGSLNMQNFYETGLGDATLLQVGDSSTASNLTIVDYHTSIYTSDNCAIEVNHYNRGESLPLASGESRMDIYGTVTVSTAGAANKNIYAGLTSGLQETGRGYINIIANTSVAGSLVNQTTGKLQIDYNGRVDVEYGDATHIGNIDLNGWAVVHGKDLGTNGNRGLNVDGTFDCYERFYAGDASESDAQVDVGHTGIITVNGSESYVVGFMELDGTFNAGDLYVGTAGGGVISSGGIDSTQTNSNFLINATYLEVGIDGQISSDGVSSLTNSLSVPGSYGGDGAGRTGTTYGAAKFTDMSASTAVPYGEDGNLTGVVTAKGGGAVRINVTGDILNNGIISANGGNAGLSSNGHGGAGGTVLINQNITHSDTGASFTGTGDIYATGGDGDGTGYPGGGGRIIIDSILYDKPDDGTGTEYGFTGLFSVAGGSNGTNMGAAGTVVFLGDDNNPNGTLLVNQEGTAPTGSATTYIPDTGIDADFTFDRVESAQGAVVVYQDAPATLPVSCYETGTGSSVTIPGGYSCANNSFPDKPYKMYINNPWIGAQTGTEPSGPNPLDVYDSTPAFSIVYAQPITANDPVNYVEIQVAENSDFTTLLWDATGTNRITLNTALNVDTRSEDIIYEGNPLAVNTPYYVRMRFVDTINSVTRGGLWNHRDMGNQYKFNIPDYVIVSNDCTDSMEITDTNAAGRPIGNSLYNAPGDRYGFDSCTISVTATPVAWLLKYSKAVGITGFFDTGEINQLAEIDNAGGDCAMDVAGNTASEKYAYNIYTTDAQLTGKVQTNATCLSASYACATYPCDNSDKYFNVENSGTADTILSTSSGAVVDAEFLLNLHINVGNSTMPEAYSLGTRMLILSPP